jgi:predicted AlkP superfamily pyrophosphatase or phosphodiesterase
MKRALIMGLMMLGLAAPAAAAPPEKPRLIVAIAVDQFSADLFAEYRSRFTGGLKTLQEGAVFPSGYQSHAASETCPGHSTILTGAHPARTGIIANSWFNLAAPRADKKVYCVEDETVPGSSSTNGTISPVHLKVPTLGDRMKAADRRSRVVAVSGKDRAAIMMGGAKADETWWFASRGFGGYAGRALHPAVARVNQRIGAMLAGPVAAPTIPAVCEARLSPIPPGKDGSIGGGLPARAAGDGRNYRASPDLDADTLELASQFVADMKLGQGPAVDLLAVSLSATDYVGHRYGSGGPEMCAQLTALDAALGRFFDMLKARGIPFVVTLTADHGGHDLPERIRDRAIGDATRVSPGLAPEAMNKAIAAELGISGPVIFGDAPFGDIYISRDLPADQRQRALMSARRRYLADDQVAAVFTQAELRAVARPTLPPDEWTLAERAAASFDPERSGDLIVLLKPHVTPIAGAFGATHGSPWDYDRRVPILFWSPGMTGFEQPLPVETVDIVPTLAALIGLSLPAGEIDGRCLDLDAGAGSTCR